MASERKPLASQPNEKAVAGFTERLNELGLKEQDITKLAKAYSNVLDQLADLSEGQIRNKKKLVFDAIQSFFNVVRSSSTLKLFNDPVTVVQILRDSLYMDFMAPSEYQTNLIAISEDLDRVEGQLPVAIQQLSKNNAPGLDALTLDSIQPEVIRIVTPDKLEIKKFWKEFLAPLETNIRRTSLPIQDTEYRPDNYIVQEILMNPKLDKLFALRKYHMMFKEDADLMPLLKEIKENFTSVAINNPQSLHRLFTSLNKLNKKIVSYCRQIKAEPQQSDISECYQSLNNYLPLIEIEPLDLLSKVDTLAHIYNANQRIAIRNSDISATMDLLKTSLEDYVAAHPQEFFNPELNQAPDFSQIELIGDYLEPDDVQNSVRSRASNNNVNLLNGVRAISGTNTMSFLEEQIVGLRQHDVRERKVAYFNAANALGTDPGLKAELLTKLQKDRSQSDLVVSQMAPQSLPSTFEGLQSFVAEEKTKARVASVTDQARFLHQVAKVRYTLSPRELDLLSTATEMNFRSLKPENYQNAINKIDAEIERREDINRGWFGLRGILYPERTTHLRAAKEYIDFHQVKRFAALEPEQRLFFNMQREDMPSAKRALSVFERLANSLSSAFTTNRAIKELNTVAHHKATQANNLKKDYASYWKEESKKDTKHAELRDKVTASEGQFYQPERIAGHNFVPQQDFAYRNKKTPNYLIAAKGDEEHADKTNELFDSPALSKVSDLSLMEITQGIYKTICDKMAKLKETDSYSKPPQNLDLSAQQLYDIGEHLEKAKNTHQELKQAISTFSQLLLAMKQFQREAATIVEKYEGNNNTYIMKDLKYQLERLDNLYEEPSDQDIKNRTPKFIGYIKNNELRKLITTIIDEIESNPDKNVIEGIRRDLESSERRIDALSKKFFSRAELQKILNVSTKNIEALTYISDHATGAFKKSDEPRR